jgi:SAM-dependent methyltransferase
VVSAYDRLGPRYDAWCRSVTEDIPFYVDLALHAGGPVLEVGVGSGRIAVATAVAGVPVVGVDSSPVMLELARERAARHGVALKLVEADMRDLPDLGTFALVTVPFRAFLHLRDDGERLAVLRALRERLRPGGTLAFDVFHPDRIDIDETHDRWMEREPGIGERAHWDEAGRRLVLSVRADGVVADMELWWIDPGDWRALLEQAGYERITTYGWFDGRPLEPGATDSVWVAHRAVTG